MRLVDVLVLLGSLLVSLLLTWLIRRHALRKGMLDVPNQRSSHSVPTPRGGGLAIVITVLVAVLGLLVAGQIDAALGVACVIGGGMVAMVGWLDDVRGITPGVRFAVHILASILAVHLLSGVASLEALFPSWPRWLCFVLMVLAVGWMLNLFNFMDGIDGIAGSEAVFLFGAGTWLALHVIPPGLTTLGWISLGACLGFLVLNWPPARIFMGDVGSGFLGYVLAVFMLATAGYEPGYLFVWLLLAGVFVLDATITLIRRLMRRELPHQAHRTHAYQWLSRRWSSHRKVTILVWVINLCWLFPIAWMYSASGSLWLVLGAFVPVGLFMGWAGAGREEGV